jgi:hypothetical protein
VERDGVKGHGDHQPLPTACAPHGGSKGCCKKKPGVFNFISLAYVSLKKIKDIHFHCKGYVNSKGLAIIRDFTSHWAIKNKQMVKVWTFDSVRMMDVLICE